VRELCIMSLAVPNSNLENKSRRSLFDSSISGLKAQLNKMSVVNRPVFWLATAFVLTIDTGYHAYLTLLSPNSKDLSVVNCLTTGPTDNHHGEFVCIADSMPQLPIFESEESNVPDAPVGWLKYEAEQELLAQQQKDNRAKLLALQSKIRRAPALVTNAQRPVVILPKPETPKSTIAPTPTIPVSQSPVTSAPIDYKQAEAKVSQLQDTVDYFNRNGVNQSERHTQLVQAQRKLEALQRQNIPKATQPKLEAPRSPAIPARPTPPPATSPKTHIITSQDGKLQLKPADTQIRPPKSVETTSPITLPDSTPQNETPITPLLATPGNVIEFAPPQPTVKATSYNAPQVPPTPIQTELTKNDYSTFDGDRDVPLTIFVPKTTRNTQVDSDGTPPPPDPTKMGTRHIGSRR
jgi:hypothetical protein